MPPTYSTEKLRTLIEHRSFNAVHIQLCREAGTEIGERWLADEILTRIPIIMVSKRVFERVMVDLYSDYPRKLEKVHVDDHVHGRSTTWLYGELVVAVSDSEGDYHLRPSLVDDDLCNYDPVFGDPSLLGSGD